MVLLERTNFILTQSRGIGYVNILFDGSLVTPVQTMSYCLFKKYFPIDCLFLFVHLDVEKHPAFLYFKTKRSYYLQSGTKCP